MREIKFRAWDKEEGTMLSDISLLDDTWDMMNEFFKYKKDELHFMQYTGLKDKNGKEIYEGDVLQLVDEIGEHVRVICEFGNRRITSFSGTEIDVQCFYFKTVKTNWKTNPVANNYKGMHDLEIIEVIGNIYEHPELVDTK